MTIRASMFILAMGLFGCGRFATLAEQAPGPVGLNSTETSEAGFVTPTVYYFPIISEPGRGGVCAGQTSMHLSSGETLQVCQKTLDACSLQGSCSIVQEGSTRSFNMIGNRYGGQFSEVSLKDCHFGFGVQNLCLDPFHSIAADLHFYHVGEVIFVPAVVGLLLPKGVVHDGFFVIRDEGDKIKGRGRFDFFRDLCRGGIKKIRFSKLGWATVRRACPTTK